MEKYYIDPITDPINFNFDEQKNVETSDLNNDCQPMDFQTPNSIPTPQMMETSITEECNQSFTKPDNMAMDVTGNGLEKVRKRFNSRQLALFLKENYDLEWTLSIIEMLQNRFSLEVYTDFNFKLAGEILENSDFITCFNRVYSKRPPFNDIGTRHLYDILCNGRRYKKDCLKPKKLVLDYGSRWREFPQK